MRLLAHKETKRVRLVMRRDKTLKVCANHNSTYARAVLDDRNKNNHLDFFALVTNDMRLQPNIGSDRSWVWKVAADVSDGEPTAETLAIRFANAESVSNGPPIV